MTYSFLSSKGAPQLGPATTAIPSGWYGGSSFGRVLALPNPSRGDVPCLVPETLLQRMQHRRIDSHEIVARKMRDYSHWPGRVRTNSRDFRWRYVVQRPHLSALGITARNTPLCSGDGADGAIHHVLWKKTAKHSITCAI
jgi:hypothetical protein